MMKIQQLQSIKRGWLTSKKGFSLVEAMLAVSVFGMLVTALAGALIYGQRTTVSGGDRSRASFLAEEGIEAVRNIRDDSYANLSDGEYGLDVSSGQWILSGTSDTQDIFTRKITISSVDTDRKQVVSEVTWEDEASRVGNVSLTTYLSNWQEAVPVGSCDDTCQTLGYPSGTCREDAAACGTNGETNEATGNTYCTVDPNFACCCVGVASDITPPAAITDLITVTAGGNSIQSVFTAPGDDGNIGTSTSYDLRFSTSLIDESNWASAHQVYDEPAPLIAGTAQIITFSGLTGSTTYYYAIKSSDEEGNESDLSNVTAAKTAESTDSTYPAAISDLGVSYVGTDSLLLSWTATGDDDSNGVASSYDIRYSNALLTEANFSSGTQVSQSLSPKSAGTPESYTVSNLNHSTNYYFAIKASDEVPYTSNISNVVSTTTAVLVSGCNTLCQSTHTVAGTCRSSEGECYARDELYESGGNTYCTTAPDNYCCCGPVADTTAPNTPTLYISAIGLYDMTITWTATGDNGQYGTAAWYDVRYSTGNMDYVNWSSYAQATGEPVPSVAGTAESFTITGLTSGTRYYIAMKVYDEAGNGTPMSNVVTDLTTTANLKVICTEAHKNGIITDEMYKADGDYAEKYANDAIMRGYLSWGKPVVRVVQRNLKLAKRVFPFTIEWSKHTSYSLGRSEEDSPIGKMLIETAFPLCEELGEMMAEDGQLDYEFDDEKVEVAMEEFYQDYFNLGLSKEELVPVIKKDFEKFMALAKEVYLEDRANNFLDERTVYEEMWYVKILKFFKNIFN